MRRRRHWISAVVVCAFALAQTLTAVHACSILAASAMSSSGGASTDDAMPHDCTDMAKHAGASSDVCESHCYGGEQVTAQADIPLPPAAPQSPLTVRVVDPFVAMPVLASAPRSTSAAPPPLLLSGRLLI
jgi:hypothetical protein